ncbi:MAG: hypothetical protein R3E31_14380 [Chloroflexota bacterium]
MTRADFSCRTGKGNGPFSPTAPSDNTAPLDIEREPWLTILCRNAVASHQRNSAATTCFAGAANALPGPTALSPPNKLNADTIGLHFMNVDGKYPKLTTAAAMIFGHLATRNTIDLEPEQVANMWRGMISRLAPHKPAPAEVHHSTVQGFTIGVGVYRAHAGLVESLYPKGWIRPKTSTRKSARPLFALKAN